MYPRGGGVEVHGSRSTPTTPFLFFILGHFFRPRISLRPFFSENVSVVFGGLDFCGVSSTPDIFIFIEFLGHFWRCGVSSSQKISKIFQIFEKFCSMKPHTAKIGRILPFLPKKAIFGSKKPHIFLNFGAFGAEVEFFSAAFGSRSRESGPP